MERCDAGGLGARLRPVGAGVGTWVVLSVQRAPRGVVVCRAALKRFLSELSRIKTHVSVRLITSKHSLVDDDNMVPEWSFDRPERSISGRLLVEDERVKLLSHVSRRKGAKVTAVVLGRAQAVLGGELPKVGTKGQLLQERQGLGFVIDEDVMSTGFSMSWCPNAPRAP